MGQIIQIAFELRNITQAALDDESSGSEHEEVVESSPKIVWMKFCKEKIEKIEKVWNRKLEDGDDEEEEAGEKDRSDDDDDNGFSNSDDLISNMLKNIGNRNPA